MSSVTPGSGHKTVGFLAREASFGSGVLTAFPIYKLPIVSIDLNPQKVAIDDPNLYGDPMLRDQFLGAYWFTGTLKLAGNFEGLLEVFRLIHGIGSYISSATGDATVKDHQFKWSDQLGSACMEYVDADVPTTKVTRLTGLKLLGFKAHGEANRLIEFEIPFFAKDAITTSTQTVVTVTGCSTVNGSQNITRSTGSWFDVVRIGMGISGPNIPAGAIVSIIVSPTVLTYAIAAGATATGGSLTMTLTPNFPAVLPIVDRMRYSGFLLGTTLDGTGDNAGNIRVRSWDLEYGQPHLLERHYGALNPDEPLRDGNIAVKWSFMEEFLTQNALLNHKVHTPGVASIILRGDTNLGTGTCHEFEITSPRAYISSVSRPIDSPKGVIQKTEVTAVRDATNAAALITRFRNQEVALI